MMPVSDDDGTGAEEQGNPLDEVTFIKRKKKKPTLAVVAPDGSLDDHGARGDDWRNTLIVKPEDGAILCRVHNIIAILKHAPEFKGRIRYNLFSEQVNIDGKDIDDVAPTTIMAHLERRWIAGTVNGAYVDRAIQVAAHADQFHPVIDYLEATEWDRTPRVEHFFADHVGAPDDEYHRAVGKSLFVSAVSRVLYPGCQCDTITVTQGSQGNKKSSMWSALFSPWYAECIDSLKERDFFSGQRGIWCLDFGELAQFGQSGVERIKQVLTMREDNYRAAYGRHHVKHPRQLIFVGGTNRDDWQMDSTGGRRFLPVTVRQQIDIDAVAAARDQLFAEALWMVRNGPGEWWDIPGALEHQDEIYVGDSWEEVIASYMRERTSATLAAVLSNALNIETGKQTRADQTRAGNALRRMGWKPKKETIHGARVAVYRKSPT